MDDIDTRIQAAMKDEFSDRDLDFDPAREPGLFAQAMSLFRGRMRGWMIFMMVVQVAIIAGAIWAAVEFFHAEDTRSQILCATIFTVVMLFHAAMKLWGFMQMNRNVILREIKRLELQLARMRSERE